MAKVEMPEHVLQVGKAQLEAWGPSETLQVVGKALPKRSGFDKVTGRARYAFDVQLPGYRGAGGTRPSRDLYRLPGDPGRRGASTLMNTYKLNLTRGLVVRAFEQVACATASAP